MRHRNCGGRRRIWRKPESLQSAEHAWLREARHNRPCDSDMRVLPDYLRRITAPFADPRVGLVTCPYRGALAEGLPSKLEALGIGADFMPSVMLTARFFGMGFAFGSTIAIRRNVLEEIGRFRALGD